jgi:hypothetical protein
MNLKSFHLVFITCASVLAFVFGLWALNSPTFGGTARMVAALGGFGVALALVGYETWFLRYSRRQG